MNALEHARALVGQGIRETGGKNRSPFVDQLCTRYNVPLGSPWCAMFVSECFRLAGASFADFPRTAGSQRILGWARSQNRSFVDPQRLLRCRGALGGWTNDDGRHGHVFLIAGRLTDEDGQIVALRTLEGNTSPITKGRDGEGAYELVRGLAETRAAHPRMWFVDVSNVPGGDFGWSIRR